MEEERSIVSVLSKERNNVQAILKSLKKHKKIVMKNEKIQIRA